MAIPYVMVWALTLLNPAEVALVLFEVTTIPPPSSALTCLRSIPPSEV